MLFVMRGVKHEFVIDLRGVVRGMCVCVCVSHRECDSALFSGLIPAQLFFECVFTDFRQENVNLFRCNVILYLFLCIAAFQYSITHTNARAYIHTVLLRR